jgi:hypothetical protein
MASARSFDRSDDLMIPDDKLTQGRRLALALIVCSVLLVVVGVWIGQWMFPFIGLIFGARGVRGYRQPDLLTNTPQDVAARVIASGSVSVEVTDRPAAAERLAALEDDLESLMQESAAGTAMHRGLTPVSIALLIIAGILLGIALTVNGELAAGLLSVVIVVASSLLLVQVEKGLARRKEAVEILRLQMSELRDRWPRLDAGERDSMPERALEP